MERYDEQSTSIEKFRFGHLMRLNSGRIPAQILKSRYRDTQRMRTSRFKWKMQVLKDIEILEHKKRTICLYRKILVWTLNEIKFR